MCFSEPSTSTPALADQQLGAPLPRYYIQPVFLQVWDMRTLKPGSNISQASKQPLRDVDWAAATPHVLSTVGDDQRLRVWDLRCWTFCSGCRRLLGRPGLTLLISVEPQVPQRALVEALGSRPNCSSNS